MAQTKSFPCIACGAPVQPEVGVTHMPCSYCGTNLAIPIEFQRDAVPLGSEFKLPEPKPSPEMETADFLRKAQPVAAKAFNLFAIWTWIRRFLPGCLIAILVIFCICLIGITVPVILQSR